MKPNILLITCDQLRLDALGCYGNAFIRTPNIDRLAASGFQFSDMHVAAPICAPNRASMATGRWPSVNGLRANGCVLPPTELTLMECLRQAGYATHGVGKMHFGPQWTYVPGDMAGILAGAGSGRGAVNPQPLPWEFPFYGFEDGQFTEDNREGLFADYLRRHDLDPWGDPHSFTYPQHICQRSAWPEEHHQTTWVADRSLDFLAHRDSSRPFFLWTSFVHPHHPFNPPVPYDTMYDPDELPVPIWDSAEAEAWPEPLRRKLFAKTGGHEAIGMSDMTVDEFRRVKAYYYGMISFVDKQVGRLLDALEAEGIDRATWIVFTADHGELMGDHRMLFKGTHHDGVTRVPFLICPPGGISPSQRDALCQSTDIMPTLLDCVGVGIPPSVQGKSLRPVMQDSSKELHREVLVETGTEMRSIRTRTARLTWHPAGLRGELYDLKSDPGEFKNRWDEPAFAKLQNDLIQRLIERVVHNLDPLPLKLAIC